jgi:putative PIN family toxin of toxin-antitoxin system
MRAVLDTVIFVRALINPNGHWGRLLFDLADRYTVILSPEVIKEIVSVLYRPSLRQHFPQMAEPAQLERVLTLFERAEVVEPGEDVSVCRDPGDDKFFACALAGRARYIVTEDKDILAVGEYRNIQSITAAEFMSVLEQG